MCFCLFDFVFYRREGVGYVCLAKFNHMASLTCRSIPFHSLLQPLDLLIILLASHWIIPVIEFAAMEELS